MPQNSPLLLVFVLALLPLLYFRLRKLSRPAPLKLERLWIRPAIILAIAAMALSQAPPRPQGWPWLVLAALLGAVAGWYWGRTMAIEVHPENGTLMARGGQAAVVVMAVLVLLRLGLRAGLAVEGRAWHLDAVLVSDASIVFSALLFAVRGLEMFLRARRIAAGAH